jgi:3-phenylpropionate/trans-cinnamate dioxygenase ferredoxin subunit
MIDVGPVDELRDGVPRIVEVHGREIAVMSWRGEVFAVRNICPHQAQSFAHGWVSERVSGGETPGSMSVDDSDPVLACPWHSWRFRLRDGSCIVDPSRRIRVFASTVESGRVLVDVPIPKPTG